MRKRLGSQNEFTYTVACEIEVHAQYFVVNRVWDVLTTTAG